ncbi:hypothetical protein Drorol1_Dr00018277 [Drosera rotundifolia]
MLTSPNPSFDPIYYSYFSFIVLPRLRLSPPATTTLEYPVINHNHLRHNSRHRLPPPQRILLHRTIMGFVGKRIPSSLHQAASAGVPSSSRAAIQSSWAVEREVHQAELQAKERGVMGFSRAKGALRS